MIQRRRFLGLSVGVASVARSVLGQQTSVPPSIRNLRPMTDGIQPITDGERRWRMEKARRLMVENRIGAIFLEGGSSMFYFTGTRWGGSERTFGMVLPARGEPAWIVPGFEEARAREVIRFGADIRTWEEDESPYRKIAQVLKDRGVASARIGLEEHVRFFVFDGIRKEAPAMEFVSADAATAGCRMIKSPAEIALMQRANDITIAAYRAGLATLEEGMTQFQLRNNITAAYGAWRAGRCGCELRKIHSVSPRQHPTSEAAGRRYCADRRRVPRRRVSVRHHPNGRVWKAHATADRDLEPRTQGASRGFRGGQTRRNL